MKREAQKTVDTVNHYVSNRFLMSDIICPCCDNVRVVPGMYRHMRALENMIDELGVGIIINSGYRCTRHNRQVGGAPRSWHLLFATDIAPENGDPATLKLIADRAEDFGFSGVGIYEKHIHLDMRPEKARWRG